MQYHPKHRIFLSIDAIGSTKLKSSLASLGCTPAVWATHFLAFLPEVEVIFCNTFAEIVSTYCHHADCGHKCVPLSSEAKGEYKKPASVWKYIGDEVVLVADLTCPDYHPALYVLALAKTLQKLNDSFQQNPICTGQNNQHQFYLQFKGTAWVAGFPVTNIEITLPHNGQERIDFLGPSIDLGFRLSKHASQEKLVVSASLAFLIINCKFFATELSDFSNSYTKLPLCFSSSIEAKGVKGGKHPLIWYPIIETNESKLCYREGERLKEYLDKEVFNDSPINPFILYPSYANQGYYAAYQRAIALQEKLPNSIFYRKNSGIFSNIDVDTEKVDQLNKVLTRISSID